MQKIFRIGYRYEGRGTCLIKAESEQEAVQRFEGSEVVESEEQETGNFEVVSVNAELKSKKSLTK